MTYRLVIRKVSGVYETLDDVENWLVVPGALEIRGPYDKVTVISMAGIDRFTSELT